jgi:hypothetical protein
VNGYDVIHRKAVQRRNKNGVLEVVEQTVDSHTEFMPMIALERLRRRFPQRWGGRDTIEVSGSSENPLFVSPKPETEYSGKTIAALMTALADVKLLPMELLNAIDITPLNEAKDSVKSNGELSETNGTVKSNGKLNENGNGNGNEDLN